LKAKENIKIKNSPGVSGMAPFWCGRIDGGVFLS